jgi:hypothetical protein
MCRRPIDKNRTSIDGKFCYRVLGLLNGCEIRKRSTGTAGSQRREVVQGWHVHRLGATDGGGGAKDGGGATDEGGATDGGEASSSPSRSRPTPVSGISNAMSRILNTSSCLKIKPTV